MKLKAFNAVLTKAASIVLRGGKKTFNFCNFIKPFIYILLIILIIACFVSDLTFISIFNLSHININLFLF